jgi:hypothetical protein
MMCSRVDGRKQEGKEEKGVRQALADSEERLRNPVVLGHLRYYAGLS